MTSKAPAIVDCVNQNTGNWINQLKVVAQRVAEESVRSDPRLAGHGYSPEISGQIHRTDGAELQMEMVKNLQLALRTSSFSLSQFLMKDKTWNSVSDFFAHLLLARTPCLKEILKKGDPSRSFKLTEGRLSYPDLIHAMRIRLPKIQFPESAGKTLRSTLGAYGPNAQFPKGGTLNETFIIAIIQELLTGLGSPSPSLTPIEFDVERLDTYEKMLAAHQPSGESGDSLGGHSRYRFYQRHPGDATVERLICPTPATTVTIKFSECQRLLAVHLVASARPLDTLAEFHRLDLLARLGSATLSSVALDALGDDRGGRFGWALAKLSSPDWSQAKSSTTSVRAWLPFPPAMDPDGGWQHATVVAFSFDELEHISLLLNDSDGPASCPLSFTYDTVNLLAEIIINQACAGGIGKGATVLASSIVAQTGLPWLPPAATVIDWSRPDRVMQRMCHAVDLMLTR